MKFRLPVKGSIFKVLLILVPLGIAGNALFMVLTVDRRTIAAALSSIDGCYIMLAFILAVIPWLTHALRMYVWSRFLGNRIPLSDFFHIAFGDELGSAVTPTSVGGGYFKLALLMQKGFSSGAAASLVALGTAENALFVIIAMPLIAFYTAAAAAPALIAVTKNLKLPFIASIYGAPIILACIFAALFHFTSLRTRTDGVVRTFLADFLSVYKLIVKRGKSRFILTMVLTSIQWFARYSIISLLLLAFHIPIRPLTFLFLQWIVFVFTTIVPTPGGSIGAEMSFFMIFSSFVPASILGFVTSCWRFLTYYFQIVTAGLCFSAMSLKKIKKERK
ncbi:MAG: flippase-like domain-containing protein [Deltaproteobacteria bacterium]|nr:flippase-like domain-containing protein [Deltaproteobacteria bacterium]